ncbi:MAG: DUF2784 domain-containing protein [Pirellulales bacterium]|nr:DUF2784 domain-containing protein [Pirellulales bacterium]
MNLYRLLADLVVAIHFAYVGFVVAGLLAILLGGWRKWRWVRNFWFRLIHFLMIAVVVGESLFGVICPLTDWEDALREKAGETVQQGTFIGRMLHDLLFLEVPQGALAPFYCVFGLIVLATVFLVPPRWPKAEGGRGKAESGRKYEV